jgi:hypothetical protein
VQGLQLLLQLFVLRSQLLYNFIGRAHGGGMIRPALTPPGGPSLSHVLIKGKRPWAREFTLERPGPRQHLVKLCIWRAARRAREAARAGFY